MRQTILTAATDVGIRGQPVRRSRWFRSRPAESRPRKRGSAPRNRSLAKAEGRRRGRERCASRVAPDGSGLVDLVRQCSWRSSSGATFPPSSQIPELWRTGRARLSETHNPGLKPWAESLCPFGAKFSLTPNPNPNPLCQEAPETGNPLSDYWQSRRSCSR
jgi:hypothetical protein